jgi:DNA-directed RNA polymerase specialized sigma24 family protein
MMNSSIVKRLIETFPEEIRLVYQAKSGDANAFVKLYDAYVERVYRYIHFLAPNNRVAEGLTLQVFFKAWEYFNRYQILDTSFAMWLYSVAQNQVTAYYLTHKKTPAKDNGVTLVESVGDFAEEYQFIRNGLQLLTEEQQQVLVLKFVIGVSNKKIGHTIKKATSDVLDLALHGLQALTEHLKETELINDTKEFQRILEECLWRLSNGASTPKECLASYPEHATQLSPLIDTACLLDLGRNVKPLPTFIAYTHDALIQYMQSHPRQRQIITPIFQRAALTFAILMISVFVITGTVHAQSALPGEPFYTWKLTSEQAWLALSSDPVATEVILSERRLNEWIEVSNDPTRNTTAMNGYLESLSKFQFISDVKTLTRLKPVLQSQQETLINAGLPVVQLDNYLVAQVSSPPTVKPTQVIPTTTVVPPTATDVPPTATNVPPTAITVLPTATNVPPTATNVSPTATDVPPTATDVPPTATDVPPTATDVPPTASIVPPTATDVPPVPTDIPTEVVPTVESTSNPEITPTNQIP